MEYTRPYVKASGHSTVRKFFATNGMIFLTNPSLRFNIAKSKALRVSKLAAGATGDVQEDTIRDLFWQSENSYEVIQMYGAIGDWSGLDDELPEGHLDPVASTTAQILDQRDYTVYKLVRRYLPLLNYNGSPTMGDCFTQLLQWPTVFQPAEIDLLLSQKAELLKRITSAAMRERANMVSAALIPPGVINTYVAATPHRVDELVRLIHEVRYTTRICSALAQLDYQPLYPVITDTVDPAITDPRQRTACRDTWVRLELEFAAARRCVDVVGSNAAKSTVNRFMAVRKAAIDNFPATLPAPTAIAAIGAALGAVATNILQLQTAIVNLPDALAGAITLPGLLGTGDDDRARFLISELAAQNTLERTASHIKTALVNSLLSGSTDDDDEDAILKVFHAARKYDQAELYQLAAAATWESLYTSFNGDQYDELETVLAAPV